MHVLCALAATLLCLSPDRTQSFGARPCGDIRGPFTLSFEVRRFEAPRPGHWGFTFRTAEGNRFFTWAQPNVAFLYSLTNRKGTRLAGGSGGVTCVKCGKQGEDVPWTKVELACDENGYVMRLGPHVCYQGEIPLLGITNLSFHASNENVEIRDVKIAPLVVVPVDSVREPTFSAAAGQKGKWDVKNVVSSRVGAFRCWMRPSGKTDNLVFQRADGSEVARFSMYMWDWPRAQVKMTAKGVQPVTFTRRVPDIGRRTDEWFHFAFTWDERARGRFLINGLPFSTGDTGGERIDLSLIGNALGETARIVVTDDNVRDLVVWRRTLTTREVMEDYRKTMPLDCVLSESLLAAGEPSAAVFRLAPGGTYLRPNPVEAISGVKAKVAVSSELERIVELRENKRFPELLTGYRFEPIPGTRTAERDYDVTKPIDIPTAKATLEPGRYRVAVSIRRPGETKPSYVRHFVVTAAPRVTATDKPRTKDDLKLGEVVVRRTFGTPYRETDDKKDSRFFDVIAFPGDRLERPYLLEIDWPDDKARAMGLYLYEEVKNSCRDHLQAGIIAGAEIPSSGQMQTARYLFYPATTNYLFEARTLIPGRPAAVRELRVYDLPEGLPALKIHYPEGLKGRTFGHCDEDQTFDNNLTSAVMKRPTTQVLERLRDYFAYTGQNAFHYSIMRYATMNFGWVEGSSGGGMWPRRQGELREVVRALGRCGIEFVPQNMFSNDPTIARLGLIEGHDVDRQRCLLDNDGVKRAFPAAGKVPMNHLDPWEVNRFIGTFADNFCDLSNQGVGRTLMCLGNSIASPLAWRSWDYGTTNKADWLTARCRPVTENVRRYVRAVTAENPELKVTVEVPSDAATRAMRGVDVEKVAAIPGVELAVIRFNTQYWFDLFRIGSKGKSDALEKLYGPQAVDDLRYLAKLAGGSLPVVYSYPTYFETFTKLPQEYQSRFGNYFQNADAKPWGRHFLRELAFCLAETDMLNYAIGMQPLGSWGSDAMVREFTQAYCALPAQPFKTFQKGAVVGRGLKTANGTYFYFVNTTSEPQTVDAPCGKYLDLSTDETRDEKTISLKPYELRSFRSLRAI